MKISLLLALQLLAAFSLVSGRPVSPEVAGTVAHKAFARLDPHSYPGKPYTISDYRTYPDHGEVLIHIFSMEDAGFVLVSADDRVRPVLGVAFGHAFGAWALPPALAGNLEEYARIIRHCRLNDVPATPPITAEWRRALEPGDGGWLTASALFLPPPPAVPPLLSTTWNQGCNYNANCPLDAGGPCGRVYTGCGATALAQLLKYHAHPLTGFGSYSHTYGSYPTQSANFGATTYNWSAMPNSLGAANAAVAELMHHCGVAARMQYGPSVSNAFFSDVGAALKKYFRYSLRSSGHSKFLYSDPAWDLLLRAELDNGRPMLYNGGPHFWVCDGYQTAPDLYHMNWGWGGTYNGWYALNNLNPGSLSFSTVSVIAGVEPVDPLEVEPGNLAYAASGGSSFAEVASDSNWTVVSSAGWLTVSAGSGGDGYYQLSVTAAPNASYFTRSAFLAFERGLWRDTVFVDQDGIVPVLSVAPGTINEGSGGGAHSLTVSSDSNWTVLSADPWLAYAPGAGVGTGTVSLTVGANGLPGPRSGLVVFGRGSLRDTVRVEQGGTAGFWCVPNIPSPTAVGASRVRLHTLDRISGVSEGYVFAPDSTRLGLDSTYFLEVSFSGSVAPAVWLDWNRDGDFFDPGEAIIPPAGSWYPTFSATKITSFTVPSLAVTGQTRLRVYVKSFPGPTSGPCDSLNVGDIEDFDVYIYDGNGPMPVAPLRLSLRDPEGALQLEWEWTHPGEVLVFGVEYAKDGHWREVLEINGGERKTEMPGAEPGLYRLRARLENGETVLSNAVEWRSGSERDFVVSPVPARTGSRLRVDLPDAGGISQLLICDSGGRVLVDWKVEDAGTVYVPTTEFPAGIYWLRLVREGRSSVRKVVLR